MANLTSELMTHYLEAILTLFPTDLGGRSGAVAPREGSYRPFARLAGGQRLRVRVIEGPPQLAPGRDALVMMEVESSARPQLSAGDELELVELDEHSVGLVTVLRVWSGAIAV